MIFFKKPVGILHRDLDTFLTINLENNQDENLYILVENMGRLNAGYDMLDTKVINIDSLARNVIMKQLYITTKFFYCSCYLLYVNTLRYSHDLLHNIPII